MHKVCGHAFLFVYVVFRLCPFPVSRDVVAVVGRGLSSLWWVSDSCSLSFSRSCPCAVRSRDVRPSDLDGSFCVVLCSVYRTFSAAYFSFPLVAAQGIIPFCQWSRTISNYSLYPYPRRIVVFPAHNCALPFPVLFASSFRLLPTTLFL